MNFLQAALDFLLALLVAIGHFSLCVLIFNRLHGNPIHRRLRRVCEILLAIFFLAMIVVYAPKFYACDVWTWSLASVYPALCLFAIVVAVPYWAWPRYSYRLPVHLICNDTRVIDVAREAGPIAVHGRFNKLLAAIPGNQILQLHVQEKTLAIEHLPAALDGLSIAHLSDLHYTGELGREFFEFVADETNRQDCDVVIVSGDIIESWACESWLGSTFGRLNARLGKYFVLGNHDKRLRDDERVRRLMCQTGLIDLGGRAMIQSWRGVNVLLAGNEQPWFPAPKEQDLFSLAASADFRILVAHGPDQFAWARRREFDLMLAGHNHGGQVRLPLAGPLISPSVTGTLYSGGLYFKPPTLLHVSRGISGEHLLRINCAPELAKLVLRRRA